MKKLSVVIPVYNEESTIGKCLKSLFRQKYDNYEIIAVDDGSKDKTPAILADFAGNNRNLKLVRGKHGGAGAARNEGVKEAIGEILVFVDADMTFDSRFLKNLVKPIINGKSKGTWSRDEIVANWSNIWARCWNINEGWQPKRRHPKNYPQKQKVFRAILKSEFDRIGGFTPGGYTDDYSLYNKLGYMANQAPNAIFYHENPGNLKEVFKQAKWAAKRQYKFGKIGNLMAMFRVSFPVSLLVGTVKSLIKRTPQFLVFKVVYDLGAFWGIMEYSIWKKGAK